jgi:hypothetical protein
MERDTLVVSDGDRTEVVTVEETFSHNGTYARVEGDTISGFVEVPDNPARPKHVLVCEDCGREPNPASDEPGPLRKENECTHRSNAELLRDIHTAKRPSHDPRVETRAA